MKKSICVLLLALATSACAGVAENQQGPLQPQATAGPCNVRKFFLLTFTAVHAEMDVASTGEACTFTMINPVLQTFPTAVLVTGAPAHGRATAGLTNGARSALAAYTPVPGYVGEDKFAITIEPAARTVIVAVRVRP